MRSAGHYFLALVDRFIKEPGHNNKIHGPRTSPRWNYSWKKKQFKLTWFKNSQHLVCRLVLVGFYIKSQELQCFCELLDIHIRPGTRCQMFELLIVDNHRQTSPLVIHVVSVGAIGISTSKSSSRAIRHSHLPPTAPPRGPAPWPAASPASAKAREVMKLRHVTSVGKFKCFSLQLVLVQQRNFRLQITIAR